MSNTMVYLVGIAGGTASGKTSVCAELKKCIPTDGRILIVSFDNFYKSMPKGVDPATYNFDHPDSFDWVILMSILTDLKAGKEVYMPQYDFVSHQRLETEIAVGPADYVLLEGIFALYDPAIRDLLDMKIFVDTESDLRLIRRIKRDIEQRGRSIDSVMNQYQLTVKPSHDQFVEPTKKYADIIIPRGKSNTVAIQLICSWIK